MRNNLFIYKICLVRIHVGTGTQQTSQSNTVNSNVAQNSVPNDQQFSQALPSNTQVRNNVSVGSVKLWLHRR